MSLRVPVSAEKLPQPGGRALIEFDHHSLALFNIDGELFAIDDSCPHRGASLCGGRLDGKVIQCCAHGLRFDLRSGYLLNSAQVKVNCYAVERDGDHTFIVLDAEVSTT